MEIPEVELPIYPTASSGGDLEWRAREIEDLKII